MSRSANADDAFRQAREHHPDIILIDIALKNDGALQLTRNIKNEVDQPKVIILGLTELDPRVMQCIEAGARGYILMEASIGDLLVAIDSVRRGETFCPPKIAYSTFSMIADLARKRRNLQAIQNANLTMREMEVLHLIAQGMSNRQIAECLCLSLHTIKNHVHNILEKLDVNNRAEAIHNAFDKGLLKISRLPRES